jgi:hypothetical protein
MKHLLASSCIYIDFDTFGNMRLTLGRIKLQLQWVSYAHGSMSNTALHCMLMHPPGSIKP